MSRQARGSSWARAALAVGATALTLLMPATAHADSGQISINEGQGWSSAPSSPLLTVGEIVPGWHMSKTVLVRNDSGANASLALRSTDIVEFENGCSPDEAAVDSTCGPNQGELGHALRFSVFAHAGSSPASDATPIWTGTLYDLAAQPLLLTNAFAAGATWTVDVAAELPLRSGNETQTDQVGFNVNFDIEGTGVSGTAQVKGIKFSRHKGLAATLTGVLPFTGSSSLQLSAAALCLIIGGLLLSRWSRARRRT